jgi:excisionase family DNA binding protein
MPQLSGMAKKIKSRKTAPAAAQPASQRAPTDLLTDAQAAALLSVEPRTLRLWRATRGLPHIRLTSKVIRYRKSDLDAWLARHLVAIQN